MNPKTGIKFSYIMLASYLMLAGFYIYHQDHQHSLMFMIGSLIWIGCIFIWKRTKIDEQK